MGTANQEGVTVTQRVQKHTEGGKSGEARGGQAEWLVPGERGPAAGRGYRKTISSTKDQDRRWMEVRPKPERAVRWDGDG